MSDAFESTGRRDPSWLVGRGLRPYLKWSVGTDGPLTCLCQSRETGDIYTADNTGTINRIDKTGRIVGLTRISPAPVKLVWSDNGAYGAVIAGEDEIIRLNQSLKTVHKLSLPDVCLAVAISPFGNHIAVSLANGLTLIYDERSKKIAQFQTMRPLSALQFCATETLIFGAAEQGLVCCHNLEGAEIWQERSLSNVGKLAITGEGDLVFTASFSQGIQAYNGDGTFIGSYLIDGTTNRVDVSFEPERVIISTVEQGIYWLDADGDQVWMTQADDNIVDVLCDPLGEWAVIGFQESGVYHLSWDGGKAI